MEIETRIRSTSNGKIITTSGEIFSDGVIMELVQASAGSTRPNLLLWKAKKARTAVQMRHGDNIYEAPELKANLYGATRFPANSGDYHSLRKLFDRIVGTFVQQVRLPQRDSQLLTGFAISSWMSDRLPIAPNVVISGHDQGLGIEVLKLLSCLCRRAFLLGELTSASFRSLPMHLSPTLLINQHSVGKSMQKLFRASSYRGLHFTGSKGDLIDIYAPKAIYCQSDSVNECLGDCAIQISLAQSRSQGSVLDDAAQTKIANEFQPQLLSYRLQNVGIVRESPVAGNGFTAATRELAFALGACLSQDPDLARETVQLLGKQDEDARAEKQSNVSCVVVEVLWAFVHHWPQKAITVDELAKLVNTLLRSRGGDLTYSAEEIGWRLRAMGVTRHSSVAGRQIHRDRVTSEQIHKLARAYDLFSSLQAAEDCSDCGPSEGIE